MGTPERPSADTHLVQDREHLAPDSKPEERRKWPRIADQERSRVWFSTDVRGAQYGHVTDISLGGLAISVLDASQLQSGQRIVVGLDGWLIPAIVKHVAGGARAGYRVGLEWVRPQSPAVTRLVEDCRQRGIVSSDAMGAGDLGVEDAQGEPSAQY